MRHSQHMKHGRLPWPTPDQLDSEAQRVYGAITGGPRASGARLFNLTDHDGRLEGPFNAMLVSPEVGFALQELGAAIRYRTTVSDRVREVAILTLAAERRSEFEAYAHEAVGAACGLTTDEMVALRSGEAVNSLALEERVTHHCVQAMMRDRRLSDQEYEQLVTTLGETGAMEIVMLVGYYDTLDLMMSVAHTPLPEGVQPIYPARQSISESEVT